MEKVVWIVNQYIGSKDHGMGFRHYYLAKELVKLGYKVWNITGGYSHLLAKEPKLKGDFTHEEIEGINYCWVKLPKYEKSMSVGRIKNMFAFNSKLKNLPDFIDVPNHILVSSPSLLPIKKMKKYADKHSAQLIFEVRDIWPKTLIEVGNISKYNPLITLFQHYEDFGYRNADKIVSVLAKADLHVASRNMDVSKFVCVPNGIDLTEVAEKKPLPDDFLQEIDSSKFIVGYAGTIGKVNAIDQFIDSIRRFKDNSNIQFIIVGKGGELEEMKAYASGLGNVKFLPAVEKAQVQSLLSKFDVCFIGTYDLSIYQYGVSPTKLFDYMLSGKPILHSLNSAHLPVDEAECGITVPANDIDAIEKAIAELYKMDQDERVNLGKNGLNFVRNNHSYASLAKKYQDQVFSN